MDQLDRDILTVLQYAFPLTVRPYRSIGTRVGASERTVIERIAALKRQGVIRQISPIFDSAKIGYRSTLAAFKVPPERVDRAAQRLSEHPGVSHNYLREGPVNLWFTLTVPGEVDIEAEIDRLADELGVETRLYLPTLRTFKIGFRLDVGGDGGKQDAPERLRAPKNRLRGTVRVDRAFVRELQRDLPLVVRPFLASASVLGCSEREVVATLKRYLEAGLIRRVASVLRPVNAGFSANVMVAWAPAEDEVERLGSYAATHRSISHCYLRPASEAWPYSVYTMIHGTSREQCRAVVEDIVKRTGVTRRCELETVKEYKKVRVEYFPE